MSQIKKMWVKRLKKLSSNGPQFIQTLVDLIIIIRILISKQNTQMRDARTFIDGDFAVVAVQCHHNYLGKYSFWTCKAFNKTLKKDFF